MSAVWYRRRMKHTMLARHRPLFLDTYHSTYAPNTPPVINSATKAVIGTLAAMAVKDGLLDSPDRKMLDFFADRSVADLDDRKKAITVQNLLDMTSGIDWREPMDGPFVTFYEMERSADWVK